MRRNQASDAAVKRPMIKTRLLWIGLLLAACASPAPAPSPSSSPSAPPSSPSPSGPPAASPSAPPSGPSDPSAIAGRHFLSIRVMQGTEEIQLVAGTRISISFMGQLSMNAGCNSMDGSYALEDDVLLVNGLSTTEMGCDPPRHAQDEWLGSFMSSRPTVALSGDELVLTAGDTSITFLDREVANPDLPLTGPTWTVDSIFTGEAVSSVPQGAVATFVFGDDGSVGIETGCNSGGGRYEVDPETSTVRFSELVFTARACAGPEGSLESSVLSVVTAVEVTYSIEAQSLTLMAGPIGIGLRGAEAAGS